MAKKGVYRSEEWVESSFQTLKALESVGTRFVLENLSAFRDLGGPCVFVANHMSTLETFVLPCIIQPFCDVTFIVKTSLVEMPVFRHVMRSRDPILVGRDSPRQDLVTVLEEGTKRLERNISVIVFPQTTRSPLLDKAKFNSIGVKLARRAGAPIVPVALKTDAWGCGRFLKEFGKVDPSKTAQFCFGEPIRVTGAGKEEHEAVFQFIKSKVESFQREEVA